LTQGTLGFLELKSV
jgi:hypothetical protein